LTPHIQLDSLHDGFLMTILLYWGGVMLNVPDKLLIKTPVGVIVRKGSPVLPSGIVTTTFPFVLNAGILIVNGAPAEYNIYFILEIFERG
jgi:hypothetical protein